MCTKHHVSGLISGTSKRVKFVENVLCRQKFYHILCCNNLIVCSCVFLLLSTYLTDLLQLYTPSQSLHLSAHSRILVRHKKFQGQRTFLYWPSSGIVCHAWTVECQTTVKRPPLFHLLSAVFRSKFISVCVDKCDVGEVLNGLWLCVYTPRLPLLQATCYVCSLWICCCEWLSVCIVGP